MAMIKITECPRDAMQGIKEFIPSEHKINYINQLLKVGFDIIDFGSFVSPRAIPQLSDTKLVYKNLNLRETSSKLLAIVVNQRSIEEALKCYKIEVLGYPYSVSTTFLKKNTNQTLEEGLKLIEKMNALCNEHSRELRVYISMAFGNPYGDLWNVQVVAKVIKELVDLGIKNIALADTTAMASSKIIKQVFEAISNKFDQLNLTAHFHFNPNEAIKLLKTALKSGCRRFDSVIGGFGGCPMAKNKLVGNVSTENLFSCFEKEQLSQINFKEFEKAKQLSNQIFSNYH